MVYNFKKEQKKLYQPKTTSIVDVPEMIFIMVDGAGNPNTSESYKMEIEILYGLSYFIKMSTKGRCRRVILIHDPRKVAPEKN